MLLLNSCAQTTDRLQTRRNINRQSEEKENSRSLQDPSSFVSPEFNKKVCKNNQGVFFTVEGNNEGDYIKAEYCPIDQTKDKCIELIFVDESQFVTSNEQSDQNYKARARTCIDYKNSNKKGNNCGKWSKYDYFKISPTSKDLREVALNTNKTRNEMNALCNDLYLHIETFLEFANDTNKIREVAQKYLDTMNPTLCSEIMLNPNVSMIEENFMLAAEIKKILTIKNHWVKPQYTSATRVAT